MNSFLEVIREGIASTDSLKWVALVRDISMVWRKDKEVEPTYSLGVALGNWIESAIGRDSDKQNEFVKCLNSIYLKSFEYEKSQFHKLFYAVLTFPEHKNFNLATLMLIG